MALLANLKPSDARKLLTRVYTLNELKVILANPVELLAAENLIANRHGRILKWFSAMAENDLQITSEITPDYNCIAWAAGKTDAAWWPTKPGYWPKGVNRTENMNSFIMAYRSIGFETCPDGDPEDGFEKIAIFEKAGRPTHASKLTADGRWSSKLGRWEDILHSRDSLNGAGANEYGSILQYMRRALATS